MSEKLKVGIIGAGRISDLHYSAYLNYDKAEISVICDVNEAVAKKRANELNCRWTTQYKEVLADKSISYVEILTPHQFHKDNLIDAVAAGKHVSLQKPMSRNVDEARQMIDAANKAGVLFKVFENFVFYPPYVLAKELMDQGEIGDPISIRIKLGSGGRGGWQVPLTSWIWRVDHNLSGGGPVLFDDGYHKYSIALWFFGDIDEIYAWVDYTYNVIDSPAIVFFKFKEHNRLGTFEASFQPHLWVNSKYYAADERVEITGTKGVIWITRCTAQLMDIPPVILMKEGYTRTWENIRSDWVDSFIDSSHHFVEQCILGEQEPLLTGEQGLKILQCIKASYLSSEKQERINPATITE